MTAAAPAVGRVELLERRVRELERELRLRDEQHRAHEWKRMQDRFHAFDAIKDDRCPSCGGAVRVEETHNAVILRSRGS